jgi:hypothetical protein
MFTVPFSQLSKHMICLLSPFPIIKAYHMFTVPYPTIIKTYHMFTVPYFTLFHIKTYHMFTVPYFTIIKTYHMFTVPFSTQIKQPPDQGGRCKGFWTVFQSESSAASIISFYDLIKPSAWLMIIDYTNTPYIRHSHMDKAFSCLTIP